MSQKKSLLCKYAIPIEHLDFEYVKTCQNIKEIQKILAILKSGEEGYYPDLTNVTAARLQQLDPSNKMLREEHQCEKAGIKDIKQLNEFIKEVKTKDQNLRNVPDLDVNSISMFIPPIREASQTDKNSVQLKDMKKTSRIAFCDYDRWDKFDADTESLKIDLNEEKNREKTSAQIKQQMQQRTMEVLPETAMLDKITDAEKLELASKHKMKGNEYFKCSDFDQAIFEYTKSLQFSIAAPVYNNRAIAHLKLKKYNKTIDDCDECLKLDPQNVKAMLRKSEALIALDKKNYAYQQYLQILKFDAENSVAKKALKDMPIRLEIEEITSAAHHDESTVKSNKAETTENCDDFHELIIPKKIVRSKLSMAVSGMERLRTSSADNTAKMAKRNTISIIPK